MHGHYNAFKKNGYEYDYIIIIIYSGPQHPLIPKRIRTEKISDSSAVIQWTVSSIAYTPETYVVEYGTSQDSLDMTSDPTHSGGDITIANVTYSVTLSDLKENTTYYVLVVATNTADRSNTSSVENFTTSSADLSKFDIETHTSMFGQTQYMHSGLACTQPYTS